MSLDSRSSQPNGENDKQRMFTYSLIYVVIELICGSRADEITYALMQSLLSFTLPFF